jgi:hypothetical protein
MSTICAACGVVHSSRCRQQQQRRSTAEAAEAGAEPDVMVYLHHLAFLFLKSA